MLTTVRPTPTTVLYTVSTRSTHKTITSKLSTTFLLILRILAGILVTSILLRDASHISPLHPLTSPLTPLQSAIDATPIGALATLVTVSFSKPWRLLFCGCLTYLIFRKGYIEESLLVIRGLGVQTTTSSTSYLWASSTRFIPTSSIQDIFIHEAFKGFEVRFYLSIVVEGEEDVVVVFPTMLPRREILEQVWRGARACLYEPKS